MLFIGGGGEPKGPTTNFDTLVETLGKNVSASNWKYQVSFNGGHSNTEGVISFNFRNPVAPSTPFTEKSYKKLIEDYKAKINSGEIASGDQMMIVINSHGAEKSAKGEDTHKIAVTSEKPTTQASGISNYDSLSGSDVVSLDSLAELVKLTNDKGIKLGIVDMSCHSGNTQALKKNAPNTCIITSTGPVHYGFSGPDTFNGKFANNFKPGMSLEQVFLKSRLEATDYGYPMISTKEGQEVNEEMYSSITPYLYYRHGATDKLTPFLNKNSSDQLLCQRDHQFKELIEKIDELQAAAGGVKGGYNGEEFKKLLTKYKAEQDAMMTILNSMGSTVADNQEIFSTPTAKNGNTVLQMSWKNIVAADPDGTIKYFNGQLAKAKTATEKSDYQAVLSNWNKLKEKRNEIISKYPDMANVEKKAKELTSKIENNYLSVYYIALQEKKFYDELYKKKQTGNSSDPCRDIVL